MRRITSNRMLMLFLGCVLSAIVAFVFASPAGGRLAMSDSEMAYMIGGQMCVDCNDCNETGGDGVYWLCIQVAGAAQHDCNSPNCEKHVFNTASCSPNQGDAATGCDTDIMRPYTLCHTRVQYTSAPPACTSRDSANRRLHVYYTGCDTSPGHYCDAHPYGGRCRRGNCPGNNTGSNLVSGDYMYECDC